MTDFAQKKLKHLLTLAHGSHIKGLRARAFFRTRDQIMGDDLVQDTFLKTWRFLVHGGKVDIMKAFLYHVLDCLIVDQYRRRKNKSASLDSLLDNGYEPREDKPESYSAIDSQAAIQLIDSLPPKYKEVMRMRYVQDLSLSEIALQTGEQNNTIAVRLHRGLAKLRLLYKPSSLVV